MQFIMWSSHSPESEAGTPPSPELMADMAEFMNEVAQAGILVTAGGCPPSSQVVRITSEGGKITHTDGPFTETKELIGGFAIVDVKSMEEAVEWSTRFFKVGGGDGYGYVSPLFTGAGD
ncbi:hypothetical protein FB566_5185 [Stackebrandtia endophytica]|uniref:YCII-related domain-containing protein n=1 Tax=Stackebrandtia endophytica TaxID=1496996 RepID=A0A543B418_9ACTN|nr:YciI family protein [Stackebrandtia endophytica]TQL79575.1 hypothetical protein FB566_5185 [Stackebrandtia endophytica]